MDEFDAMRGPDAPTIEVGFSDQDPAIAAAYAKAFPTMTHLLCVWHLLGKNLVANMKVYFSSKSPTLAGGCITAMTDPINLIMPCLCVILFGGGLYGYDDASFR
jgi:hypothetical protein